MASKSKCSIECHTCNKKCRDNYDLKRHLKTHSSDNIKDVSICPICQLKVSDDLQKHLDSSHNITLQKENLTFPGFSEFTEWKKKLEGDTRSRYVKHYGSYKRQDGISVSHYYCHRDGIYIPKGMNIRSNKMMGSNKINAHCPASMKVEENSEGVIVHFISTHIGHNCEISRMILSKSEKDKIATQIAMKIPLEDILDGIRNSLVDDDLQKLHLSTKQDLRNIIAQYGLDSEQYDANDAKAVDKWVMYMSETSDIVRLYKPQGIILPDFPQLKADDFCLILSNNVQLDVLRKFGNDIICVDGTHGLTGYDFQLFTIQVLDEMRSGFPCAFMFCNRSDSVVMELFFKTILTSVVCDISPKYFMSDMDESFFNAWCSLFPRNETQQLYCAWHVDRAWQQNLSKVKSYEKKAEVYKQIKVLMLERDKRAFDMMSKHLLQELYSSDLTIQFAKYFERFIHEPSKWAYCYRLQAGINTNMSIEVFHRNLKHIYLAGRKVKKLIKSIHALLKFLRDRIFQRLIGLCTGNVTKKLSSLRKRHKTSCELSVDSVHQLSAEQWSVFSGTEIYSVSLLKKDCDCKLRCDDCVACLHSFSCTCTDSAVLWNMCKHIHLVCRAISPVLGCPQTQDFNSNIDPPAIENSTGVEMFLVKELSTRKKVDDLEDRKRCEERNILRIIEGIKTEAGFQAYKKCIAPLEVMIKSAENSEVQLKDFVAQEETSREPQNKKISPQRDVMFYSTKKKRKASAQFKRPSRAETDLLAVQLLNGPANIQSMLYD